MEEFLLHGGSSSPSSLTSKIKLPLFNPSSKPKSFPFLLASPTPKTSSKRPLLLRRDGGRLSLLVFPQPWLLSCSSIVFFPLAFHSYAGLVKVVFCWWCVVNGGFDPGTFAGRSQTSEVPFSLHRIGVLARSKRFCDVFSLRADVGLWWLRFFLGVCVLPFSFFPFLYSIFVFVYFICSAANRIPSSRLCSHEPWICLIVVLVFLVCFSLLVPLSDVPHNCGPFPCSRICCGKMVVVCSDVLVVIAQVSLLSSYLYVCWVRDCECLPFTRWSHDLAFVWVRAGLDCFEVWFAGLVGMLGACLKFALSMFLVVFSWFRLLFYGCLPFIREARCADGRWLGNDGHLLLARYALLVDGLRIASSYFISPPVVRFLSFIRIVLVSVGGSSLVGSYMVVDFLPLMLRPKIVFLYDHLYVAVFAFLCNFSRMWLVNPLFVMFMLL